MGKYIGVDWAAKGWFAFILNGEDFDYGFYPTISDLWESHEDSERVAIDIPIGLASQRRRTCDIEAKQVLGSQGSSVFYTPIREAVMAPNIGAAKAVQDDLDFGIQNQAWAIVPRIRELDHFLRRNDDICHSQIIETHPEVAFAALNGGTPLIHSKDTTAGERERLEQLESQLENPETCFEEIVSNYEGPDYAMDLADRDDILDAMAAAVVARDGDENPPTLPKRESAMVDQELGRTIKITYSRDVDWDFFSE